MFAKLPSSYYSSDRSVTLFSFMRSCGVQVVYVPRKLRGFDVRYKIINKSLYLQALLTLM